MRPRRRSRLLAIPLVWLPALLGALALRRDPRLVAHLAPAADRATRSPGRRAQARSEPAGRSRPRSTSLAAHRSRLLEVAAIAAARPRR